jgi:hypothetical protein
LDASTQFVDLDHAQSMDALIAGEIDVAVFPQHSNPSPLPNSLLTGKLTGNFVKIASLMRFCTLTREQIQRLAAKFPTQQNRELFRRNREFWTAPQGVNRDHKRRPRRRLIASVAASDAKEPQH